MPTATSYTSKIRYLSVAKNVKVQLPGGVSNTFRPGLSDMCSDFKTTSPATTTTTGGIITTICGNGSNNSSGNGGLAVNATMQFPSSIAVDSVGNIFILDKLAHSLRKIDTRGIITTIAGGRLGEFLPGAALNSPLQTVNNIILDNITGDIYICGTTKVAKLTPSLDTPPVYNLSVILDHSVFPNWEENFRSLAFDSKNRVFYAMSDYVTNIVYSISIPYEGGAGIAINFLEVYENPLNYCLAITVDSGGNLYVLDAGAAAGGEENKLFVFDSNGNTVSQTSSIFAGENARTSTFNITVDSSGNVYVTEPNSSLNISLIRKVDTSGNITTIVGGGVRPTFSGDGGLATQSNLNYPTGLAVDSKSNLFICDALNRRVRKVTPVVTTKNPGKTTYNPPWFAPVEYRENCNCKLVIPPAAVTPPVETAIIYDGQ